MLTEEQILALNSKGYDVVFERNDKIYSIKTSSLPNWDKEKKKKFRKETGLDFGLTKTGWVFYNYRQYEFRIDTLRYIGKDKRPEQPINCKDYDSCFCGWEGTLLDLSHWDVSNALSFESMFYHCEKLKHLDLSGWDVKNCTNFKEMFGRCDNLTTLNLDDWNPCNGINFYGMFYKCKSIKSLDVEEWDIAKGRNLSIMFCGCHKLVSLDLSNWCIPNGADISKIFMNSGLRGYYDKTDEELEEILEDGEWSTLERVVKPVGQKIKDVFMDLF